MCALNNLRLEKCKIGNNVFTVYRGKTRLGQVGKNSVSQTWFYSYMGKKKGKYISANFAAVALSEYLKESS